MYTPSSDITVPPAVVFPGLFPSIGARGAFDEADEWLYLIDPSNFDEAPASRIHRINVLTEAIETWQAEDGTIPPKCVALEFNSDFSLFYIRDTLSTSLRRLNFASRILDIAGDLNDSESPITQICRVPESSTQFYALSSISKPIFKFSVDGDNVDGIEAFIYGGLCFGNIFGLDQTGALHRPMCRSVDGDGFIAKYDMGKLPFSTILGGRFHEESEDTEDGPAAASLFTPKSVMPNADGSIVFFTSRGLLKQISGGEVTTLGDADLILGFSKENSKLVTIHAGEKLNIWTDT